LVQREGEVPGAHPARRVQALQNASPVASRVAGGQQRSDDLADLVLGVDVDGQGGGGSDHSGHPGIVPRGAQPCARAATVTAAPPYAPGTRPEAAPAGTTTVGGCAMTGASQVLHGLALASHPGPT